MSILTSPHEIRSALAYDSLIGRDAEVPRDLANSIERFFKFTNTSRKRRGEYQDVPDCEAAITGVKLVSLLNEYFHIREYMSTDPFASDGKNFYFSRDLGFKRILKNMNLLACFPGPLPGEIGQIPGDDTERYRAVCSLENKKSVIFLDRENSANWANLENQVRNLTLNKNE